MEDRALALSLLSKERMRIAAAAYRLGKKLDGRVGEIPEPVALSSICNLLRALEGFLTTNDPRPLMELVRGIAQLRQLSGFGPAQLVAMSHAYLPSIRKVFLHFAPDVHSGLEAYERVERTALPLIVQILRELQGTMATAPHDDLEPGTDPGANPFVLADDDEVTAEG